MVRPRTHGQNGAWCKRDAPCVTIAAAATTLQEASMTHRHLQGEDNQGRERSTAGGEKGAAVPEVIDDHAGG